MILSATNFLTLLAAQVMKDEQGRPFIVVKEYVLTLIGAERKARPRLTECQPRKEKAAAW